MSGAREKQFFLPMHFQLSLQQRRHGNISSKRGQIKQMSDRARNKVIDADVPLGEMFGYATALRSMSQGQASYTMEFSHYAEVPKHTAEKIIGEGAKIRVGQNR